jgi:hypothetical protein
MIRIQLQPRRWPFLPHLLLGLGVFLAGVVGFSYLARDEHPFPWPGPAAVEPPAETAEQVVLPPAAEAAPSQPSGGTPSQAALPAPAAGAVRAAAEPPPAPARAVEAAPVPAVPRPPAVAGPLCLRILQLHERLPAAVRCTSLSGSATGEYTIEGTVPSGDFPQLIALLDGLPARPTLSGGMAGKKEGDYAFNLHGQYAAEAPARGAPLTAGEAQGLFAQAAALARKSRLDSVRVGAPLFTPTGKGVVQQRQKLWATGSYPQLKGFVETLSRQQPQLRLEEVMMVPQYKGEAQWKQAQFYAVLSAPVRAVR